MKMKIGPSQVHCRAFTLLGLLVVAACGAADSNRQATTPTQTEPPRAELAQSEAASLAANALGAWRKSPTKRRLVDFVDAVSTPGSATYVPPKQRIAVFDNDGTLMGEKPIYVQLAFTMDRIRALAPQHPEWRTQQPFKAVLAGDIEAALAGGRPAITAMLEATHAGTTPEAFSNMAKRWLKDARHPATNRRYVDMTYQPMVELITYLREHGFKVFICTGGGSAFVRAFAEEAYGIPPQQVIGSRMQQSYESDDNGPSIMRHAKLALLNDGTVKPVSIQAHIGRRPIAAFGNSDGDLAMLEWVTAGAGARLGAILHHTDSEREWAYDRDSAVGKLDQALDKAKAKGWLRIDMGRDWSTIYAADK